MLGWFRKLLPREERFFDLFDRHAQAGVGAAEALQRLLAGDDVETNADTIVHLEAEADAITDEVMLAVRRSFITPFDRGDITDLIQSMDDAIDMMNKTVKSVRLFELREFDPLMRELGGIIVRAAHLSAEAVPLLSAIGPNVAQLTRLTEEMIRLEDHSDDLHDQGMKELFRRHAQGNAMGFIAGREVYGQLEKVVDRFENVAREIGGIVVENV